MNEIVYCYSVKLYIIHNIDMVHIIVDKHMNKINKYRTIAKGYRIAANSRLTDNYYIFRIRIAQKCFFCDKYVPLQIETFVRPMLRIHYTFFLCYRMPKMSCPLHIVSRL